MKFRRQSFPAARTPLARMMRISRKLIGREKFNMRTLAEELEVSRKTVDRDICFMRDQLGYEIEYCPSVRSFVGRPTASRIL